ncbi:Retrovirus-related Pol polyprotein from transposon RE2 [Bienertia sinuspersici]
MSSSSNSATTVIEPGSPLYLHPYDGTSSVSMEKLMGFSNYRPWRRSFEIALASKRKLGFVTRAVERDENDKVKQDAWDTYNSMVISWILANVSDGIKKSVMYTNSAKQIWRHSRAKVQELENLTDLPPITKWTEEIGAFVKTLHKFQDEQKLFQFLNGLDEVYSTQRSNLLMKSPLPSTEEACYNRKGEKAEMSEFKNKGKEVTQNNRGGRSQRGQRGGRAGRGAGKFAGIGEIELTPRVKLKDIVYVPEFKHNLMSIHKFVRDNNLKAVFYPSHCIILCKETGKIQALGKEVKGLYYLLGQSGKEILKQGEKGMQKENAKAMNASSDIQVPSVIEGVKPLSLTSLWHQRLGHAPLAKIKKIKELESIRDLNHEKCVVCPQAKFTKLSYSRTHTLSDRNVTKSVEDEFQAKLKSLQKQN